MKRSYFLFLAMALSGCVIPTGPETPAPKRQPENLWTDLFRSPIPDALYDGIFRSRMEIDEFIDSAGRDSATIHYFSQPMLINRLGNNIFQIPYRDSVEINNVLFSHSPGLALNFPSPVTWSMKGDSYFPAFSHTINSEAMPSILTPSLLDSLNPDSLIHLTYDAPSADTIEISATYIGKAHWVGDPSDSLYFAGESNEYISVNNGHVSLLPFKLDTVAFTSFNPTLLDVSLAWAQGDTIHVDGKIFGFVTEVSLHRYYSLK